MLPYGSLNEISKKYLHDSVSHLLCCCSVLENSFCSSVWGILILPYVYYHVLRSIAGLCFATEAEDREVCDSIWLLWNSLLDLKWIEINHPTFHKQFFKIYLFFCNEVPSSLSYHSALHLMLISEKGEGDVLVSAAVWYGWQHDVERVSNFWKTLMGNTDMLKAISIEEDRKEGISSFSVWLTNVETFFAI